MCAFEPTDPAVRPEALKCLASGQEVLEQLGPGRSFSGSLPHSTSRELLVPQSDSVTARPEALETIIWPSTLHCCRASGGWPAGGHESKVRDVGVGLPAAVARRRACCARVSLKIASMRGFVSRPTVSGASERTSHDSSIGLLRTAHSAMWLFVSSGVSAEGPE